MRKLILLALVTGLTGTFAYGQEVLDQSTAAVIRVGSLVDEAAATPETGITVTNLSVEIAYPYQATTLSDMATNCDMSSATGWTLGAGWAISGGVASATTSSAALQQDVTALENIPYEVTYTVSNFSAGTVTVSVGGTNGTARSSNATFTETIVAGSDGLLAFTGSGATLDIDDCSIRQAPLEFTPTVLDGGTNDMIRMGSLSSYYLELTAANTAYLGTYDVSIYDSGEVLIWDGTYTVRDKSCAFDGNCVTVAGIWDHVGTDPGQGAPAAEGTATLEEVLMHMYKCFRNEGTSTATLKTCSDDNGTVDFKWTLADDGSTFTQSEAATGP